MRRGEAVAGQRIAVDPPWTNLGIEPSFGTVLRIADGGLTLVVLYDGKTTPSTIDPRIARGLKEGEQ